MDDHHELTAAYALDALDPRERERYENHLATCESCREELASFWAVSGALAHAAGGPSPAPALRERILAQAKSEQPNVVRLRPLERGALARARPGAHSTRRDRRCARDRLRS